MKENKRNKLKTTLQIIMYIFIILSFLRSFLARASAEDAFNPNAVTSVYDILEIFENDVTVEEYQTILSYVAQYSSCILFYDVSTHTLMLNATNSPESYNGGIDYNTGLRYLTGFYYVTTNNTNLATSNIFKLFLDSDYCYASVSYPTTPVSYSHPSGTYVYGLSTTDIINHTSVATRPYVNIGSTYRYYTPDMPNALYQRGTTYYFYPNFDQFAGSFEFSMTSYTDDSRLKFWTVNETNGTHTLVTVLDDFMQGTEGIMLNEFSNVSLTYELNGIEHSVVLNSSNSIIRAYGTATTYKIETPFSVFGFDSDTISLRIIKCNFSHIYSAYGYSTTDNYKISCDYLAFSKYVPESPSDIPKDSNVGSPLETPEQKADRYYNIRFNDNQEMSFDDFYDVVFPDEYTLYYVIGSNVSTVHDIASYFPIEYPFAYLLDIATDTLFSAKIEDYLKNNYLTSYFDCIVFEYIYEDSSSLTRTYWYYTTVSGRLRTTNSILGDIYSEVNKSSYTLGVLYDFLYERLYDWELKSLDYLAELVSFEGEAVAWLSTTDSHIKDGFTRVIGSGGYSLSDIYNLLLNMSPSSSGFNLTEFIDAFHSKMVYLFVPSYDGFEDNVSTAIDDIGILAMPFYTLKYFLDSAKEAEYKETLDITFPSFEYSGTQYWDSYTASFNPSSIFPDDWFEFLQYCNLLFFSLAIALLTYKHIFGDSTDVRSNTL